jgi:uncharacterized phage-like protein YoqJ
MEQKICTIAGRTVAELPWGMDEGHPDCIALKLCLASKIAELNAVGVTEFFTNCEYGVPLFAAEAVLAVRNTLDVRLNVCMPHEHQADRYSREVRERFFDVHANADSVEILSRQEHDCCYIGVDMFMVHYSDVLLTDNMESFIAGYAAEKEKPIVLFGGVPLEC